MTSIAPPICGGCEHLRGDLRDPKCAAFPTGIPNEILLSKTDHRKPVEGDHGIRFAPKNATAEKYADQMFSED